MRRKELISGVSDILRKANYRKSVNVPKHTFHISDDYGNSRNFVVRQASKDVLLTNEDVSAVIDALLYVVVDAIRKGDNVSIHGFGSIGLQYRKPRETKMVGTDDIITIAGRYVPKFTFGNELREAARFYESTLKDDNGNYIMPENIRLSYIRDEDVDDDENTEQECAAFDDESDGEE